MMKLVVSGLCRSFSRTVGLAKIGFDAWCAAYGRTKNAQMAIGNINAKIVKQMTKICVVDSRSQHPFMVACLLNAVSLRYIMWVWGVLLCVSYIILFTYCSYRTDMIYQVEATSVRTSYRSCTMKLLNAFEPI